MEIIKTYSERNAIKVIAFAIYFSQKFSSEEINILIEKANKIDFFNKEFDDKQSQDEVAVIFSPDGVQTKQQTTSGISYNKLNDNNTLQWSLTINKDAVIITCREYSNWDNISLKAYSYIEEAFNLIKKDMNISQVTLEYLDEFEILTDSSNWKKLLFKKDSEYITSHIYELDDFWHINQGSFAKLEKLDKKLLDTININYFSDERDNLRNKLNIRTQHTLPYENIYNKNLKGIFDIIHIHSKAIFEKIIHNDILNSFNKGKGQ